MAKGVDPIVAALSDGSRRGGYYQERGRFDEADGRPTGEIEMQLQTIPSERRYLVTSHDAFHYFTRSYLADPGEKDWAKRFAAPEGLAPRAAQSVRYPEDHRLFAREKNFSCVS